MGNHGIAGNVGDVTINTENRYGVINATGRTIRIYYSKDKIELADIVRKGSGGKQIFKDSCGISCIEINVNSSLSFLPKNTRYTAIYLESSTNRDECEQTIAENYEVKLASGINSGVSGNYVGGNMTVNTRVRREVSSRSVFNATGNTIRVYCDREKMQSGDIMVKGREAGKLAFKEDSSIPFISILPDSSFDFEGEGINYASIYLQGSGNECQKTISENYEIPVDKSFIVTADLSIKFH